MSTLAHLSFTRGVRWRRRAARRRVRVLFSNQWWTGPPPLKFQGVARKLNLKAKDESSISHFSLKRLVPGGFE